MAENIYYLYMLRCSNDAIYIGYTTDMARRYAEHRAGSAKCKFTRSFPPQELSACWESRTEVGSVLQCENQLKKLTRAEKLALIATPTTLADYLQAGDLGALAWSNVTDYWQKKLI